MMNFDRETEKKYYQDMTAAACATTVAAVGPDYVELAATVAYPEGGGQESDTGIIRVGGGAPLRFVGVRKLLGRPLNLPGFPDIDQGGIIRHVIAAEDVPQLAFADVGASAVVEIDVDRRARLSLSHTASHVLYMAVERVRPDALAGVLGCHIKTDGARFDFKVAERFNDQQIKEINEIADAMIAADLTVELYADERAPDARYWRCDGRVIPCGGTHLASIGPVGPLSVKRKNLGAGKERVSCAFNAPRVDVSRYHV